ncbi:MAG: hypothetical protein MJB12_17740 [Firmicutes bacterium]|nr:hypothetical protein [Bacillota bacterium]
MKKFKLFYYVIFLAIVLIIVSYMNTNLFTKKYDTMIPLKFDEVVNSKNEIESLDESQIVKVLKDKIIDHNVRIFIFIKENDKEYIYGGAEINNNLFDLGIIAMTLTEQNLDLISVNSTKLCNTDLLRITGVLGANYSQANYYLINDGVPQNFISIDGNIREVDLDNDGITEVISSYGTAPYTYIYKCNKDSMLVADINKTLQAGAAWFNDKNKTFEAFYGKGKDTKIFKYTKNGLLEIKK